MQLAVNARVTAFAMGGQMRVAAEIIKRLGPVRQLAPKARLEGAKGHGWEQFALPWLSAGDLLWSPSATGPLAKANQVVTLHDVAFFDVPEFFSASFGRFYRLLTPALARRARHVVTVSEFSRRRIIALMGVAPEDVSVIGNGVTALFRPYAPADIDATRAALDLPARYLLLQATADRRKNLPRMLAVWREISRELPQDLWLVVSGKLTGAHVFGDITLDDAPRTRALGFVDDAHMGPLMAGAEAFLFPSLYEGFGLPIVEAFACGAPVLTSAATATAEVAGDAALLVDPRSERAIADGVKALVGDAALRGRLAEAGLARARLFSWDDAAERYRALFERLGATLPA
jgi:glycosyltransferase involved in cell wall biosynthesis